jgi:hypothetical protein
MPVRPVVTMHAKPGKGTALARVMADRCRDVQQEPGCCWTCQAAASLAPPFRLTQVQTPGPFMPSLRNIGTRSAPVICRFPVTFRLTAHPAHA